MRKKLVLSYELFFKYGGEGGIDSLRSPCGQPTHCVRGLSNWLRQLSNPGRGFSSPLECNMRKKSSHFRTSSSLNMAVRGDSNPGRGFSSPLECNMRKKKLALSYELFFEYGGEGGIRTPIRCRIHTFQACSFSHSDTSPNCFATKPHGWQRGATIGSWSKTVKKNFNDNYCLLIL